MPVTIYTLEDPTTSQIRYVGKTKHAVLSKRLQGHLDQTREKGRKNHRLAWLLGLLDNNLKPIIKELDSVPEQEWQYWEIYWIAQCKAWGFDLVNGDLGGLGGHRFSKETLAKLSKIRKGSKSPMKGKKHTEESKAKMSASKLGDKRPNNKFNKLARVNQLKAVSGARTKKQLHKKFTLGIIKSVIMNGCIPFETVKEASAYIAEINNLTVSRRNISCSISRAAKTGVSYYGHTFNY